MYQIVEVAASDLAFGGDMKLLMPAMGDIPVDYPHRREWTAFVSQVFFKGMSEFAFTPREGVDKVNALRHWRAIMCSFAPKHEHKEAACAWLLSQWFEWEKEPTPAPAPEPSTSLSPEEQEWKDWYDKKVRK